MQSECVEEDEGCTFIERKTFSNDCMILIIPVKKNGCLDKCPFVLT